MPGPSPGEKVGRQARGAERDVSTSERRATQRAVEPRTRGGQAGHPARGSRGGGGGGGGGGGPPKPFAPARHSSEPRAGGGWRERKEAGGRPRREDGWNKDRRDSGGRGDPRGGKKRERKQADPEADAKAALDAEKAMQKKQKQERKQAGLPMRTRSEGGRKRRKRK